MCGIAGLKTNFQVHFSVVEEMLNKLQHRGPDSKSSYVNNGYSAGMRRLAINGLQDGNQPLYSEDGNVVVFYNGEIYNAPQLRKTLEEKGYKFKTKSDGEVICHLYHELQERSFGYLDGMFAIAIWVVSEQKLVLVRDIPGEKPLYYSKLSETEIAFSSEIKSLKASKLINYTLNRQAIWDFPTFLWIPEPDTIYNEMMAIPPGHYMVVDSKKSYLKSYEFHKNWQKINSTHELIEETRAVVSDAVYSRLLSEVPIGCFLSGGLDSSIVTTLAAEKTSNLFTFSVGFEDIPDPYHGSSDESTQAAEYASYLKTNHHTVRVDEKYMENLLGDFCLYGDQPFAVSSGLGILAIAKRANDIGLKVLLSGDGADESFGGYSWYFHLNNASGNGLHKLNHDPIISFQNIGLNIETRLKALEKYSPQEKAWAWHYYAHESEKSGVFSKEVKEGLSSSLRHFALLNENSKAEDYIKHDRNFYFPNEMLRKLDRMTMAYSIEGRAPFAAPSILSFADQLKFDHMVNQKTLKWVLREAFSDVLPESIIKRSKHGFNVPIDYWLKRKWYYMVEETFSSNSALAKEGLIDKNAKTMADQLLFNNDRLSGHTLFCYIMLNRWLEEHHGNYC